MKVQIQITLSLLKLLLIKMIFVGLRMYKSVNTYVSALSKSPFEGTLFFAQKLGT
jgi:hypothetical protein